MKTQLPAALAFALAALVFGVAPSVATDINFGNSSWEDRFNELEAEVAGLRAEVANKPGGGGGGNSCGLSCDDCCNCCCGIIHVGNRLGLKEAAQKSNYRAVIDPEECIACGVCIEPTMSISPAATASTIASRSSSLRKGGLILKKVR